MGKCSRCQSTCKIRNIFIGDSEVAALERSDNVVDDGPHFLMRSSAATGRSALALLVHALVPVFPP